MSRPAGADAPGSGSGMSPELLATFERLLSARVVANSRVTGGDINDAYRLDLSDRRRVFVKLNAAAPAGLFDAEVHGLSLLRATSALPIPEVLAVGSCAGSAYLALEWIEVSHSPSPRADERLGRGLAALHRHVASGFGLERDNYIGRLPQANRRYDNFRDFFAEQRLIPQFRLAQRFGLFDARIGAQFERLIEQLERFLGDPEPPATLHGDLWSGNVLFDVSGAPWLIDPAVYGGHREIDLAMMRLFGGFSSRVFHAYEEVFPLGAGHRERVPLMQLYPLLVHVNLFGGGYVASARRVIEQYTV